jgi:hypothetical protein
VTVNVFENLCIIFLALEVFLKEFCNKSNISGVICLLFGLRFYISEYNGQGHLANDESFYKKHRLHKVLNH